EPRRDEEERASHGPRAPEPLQAAERDEGLDRRLPERNQLHNVQTEERESRRRAAEADGEGVGAEEPQPRARRRELPEDHRGHGTDQPQADLRAEEGPEELGAEVSPCPNPAPGLGSAMLMCANP